jgi:hypothetical protein
MKVNLNRTIEELESSDWGAPTTGTDVTGLVITCHLLRKKPLKDFSIEDLRMMIGQDIGTIYLLPIAIAVLKKDIMCEGDYYEGDLLHNVLSCKTEYWRAHKKETAVMLEILENGKDQIKGFGTIDSIRDELLHVIEKFIVAYQK